MNFREEDEFRFLDRLEGIPEELLDDNTNIFINFYTRKDRGNVLSLRVADRRRDNREGAHTTIFFVLPPSITKSSIENVCRDVESVRRIFARVLEKSKSHLL